MTRHKIKAYELGGRINLEYLPLATEQIWYSQGVPISQGDLFEADCINFEVTSVSRISSGLLRGTCKAVNEGWDT